MPYQGQLKQYYSHQVSLYTVKYTNIHRHLIVACLECTYNYLLILQMFLVHRQLLVPPVSQDIRLYYPTATQHWRRIIIINNNNNKTVPNHFPGLTNATPAGQLGLNVSWTT